MSARLTYPCQKEKAISENSFQIISKAGEKPLIFLVSLQIWIIIAGIVIILAIILWRIRLKKKKEVTETKDL